jgi:alpha-beta hydrolase superfamily lysophospholipase
MIIACRYAACSLMKTSRFLPTTLALAAMLNLAFVQAKVNGAEDHQAKVLSQPHSHPLEPPSVSWTDSKVKTRVVLLCIHGLGLHKGTYESFGKEMCKYGIATYAIDCRGFGQWLKSGEHTTVDFDGTLADIKAFLQKLRADYPGVPIVILGESMGGAIALHSTALFPDLIDGEISSVPAGDRYNEAGQDLKIGFHIVTGGFNKPLNIGNTIVKQATKKSDLRTEWSDDPMGKMKLSPSELMQFSKFMSENFEAARMIQKTPVLFIQGAGDKLVRPAGTWKLCDSLTTPHHELVFSKTGEHLIFEDTQFSPQDLLFVRTWIDKNVAAADQFATAGTTQESSVLSSDNSTAQTEDAVVANGANKAEDHSDYLRSALTSNAAGTATVHGTMSGAATARGRTSTFDSAETAFNGSTTAGGATTSDAEHATGQPASISYWIELFRNGRNYRCNNKTQFHSGDAIRFHLSPGNDGYAYIIMKESSSGKRAVLFPTAASGINNFLRAGHDYPLPNKSWLEFDNHSGIEHIDLIFSAKRISPEEAERTTMVAYVSHETSGTKDLVPTRMQLSWDDPTPVIIPDDYATQPKPGAPQSSVRLSSTQESGVIAIEIALAHE